ncbi:MAG: hypothetical protein ACPGGK_18885 [Pikeienuella sp.]
MQNMKIAQVVLAASISITALVYSSASISDQAFTKPSVTHHETKRGDELIESIKITRGARYNEPYKFYTLYKLKVEDLKPGDVVRAVTQFEATNDLGFNVMLAHSVLFSKTETLFQGEETGPRKDFMKPCVPAGENITPGMHHGYRSLSCFATVQKYGDHWISVIVYGASTAAIHHPDPEKAKDILEIERRYGGLSAIVYRN